jgi:hypothetical protein
MTWLKLVFRITYQVRLVSALMARHIIPMKSGPGFGVCPVCLAESSGSSFGVAVDLRRHWAREGNITRANGVCCRARPGCDRRTRGDVHRCERRSTPADRRLAALDIGIMAECGREA